MALISTGRVSTVSGGEGQSYTTTEYLDDTTGSVLWDAGAPETVSGDFNAQYYQGLQNIGNNSPGGTVGAISESAAQLDPRGTMSNVLLSQSKDFFDTAVPVKNDLVEMTTYNGNKGVVDGLKSQGMATVNQSFDNAQGQAERNTQRYGMALTKEQGDAQTSALSSGKALAEVDATNRATQFQQDLNKQLVSGMGSPAGITK